MPPARSPGSPARRRAGPASTERGCPRAPGSAGGGSHGQRRPPRCFRRWPIRRSSRDATSAELRRRARQDGVVRYPRDERGRDGEDDTRRRLVPGFRHNGPALHRGSIRHMGRPARHVPHRPHRPPRQQLAADALLGHHRDRARCRALQLGRGRRHTLRRRGAADPVLPYGLPPISADPPLHTWSRRLLLPWFSHRRVEGYEAMTRELCKGLIGTFVDEGEADAATQYAQQIPVRVIAHILGVPNDLSDTFTGWVRDVLEFADDPERRISGMEGLITYF